MTESTEYLIAVNTVLNEIGIVFLMIFSIKILLNLYKYNIRMYDFYTSRAKIIALCQNQKIKFRDLIKLFDVTEINFDKTPDPINKEVLKLLKSAFKK